MIVQAPAQPAPALHHSTGKRDHVPVVQEVAGTLVLAEKFRRLADGEHDIYPGTIGALWGVALTAQRTGAFLKMRLDRLFEPAKSDRHYDRSQRIGLKADRMALWSRPSWPLTRRKAGISGSTPSEGLVR